MALQPHMTKTERTCPRCGLVFASEKLDGLCPACLLGSLFDDNSTDDSKAFWEDDAEAAEPAPNSTPPAPVRRFSHFELLEELGRGGMGIVYRARDIGTGRIIALKVLQAHHLEVPDLVTRFRSEVRAVTSLDHPHVLPVHEVGEYEGIPFFSMKLTTGGSLAQRVGDFLGRPTEIARLLAKVARGVAHAHERGILHRDLKPGNILLDSAGEPFVCDFGLAKWIEDDRNLTITSAVLGTPHYIAPEQASGQKGLTTAADIYSLGAIIYELLTARPPFVGQSIIETLRLASENTPERPSSLAQNIPRDLETICLKCLEREPASRYPSATALAIDLENWLEGRPILARPVGAAEQLWRWARRNPLPAALIASVAMLLVATAVVATVSAVRIEKARDQAVTAEAIAREKLYESLLAQARASLLTGQAGHSLDALKALREAARIHDNLDLRNLAVRALSFTDIEAERADIPIGPSSRPPRSFDSRLEHIAEESGRGALRILRLADGATTARLEIPDSGLQTLDLIAFSPDDRHLIARQPDGRLLLWDVAAQKLLRTYAGAPVEKAPWYARNFAFTADSSILAISRAEGGIAVYPADSDKPATLIPVTGAIRALAFSPDGSRLAVAEYGRPRLQIWDLSAPRLALELDLASPAYSLDWHPNGRELVAGCFDSNLYLLDARNGQRKGTFSGHLQEITQVLFSPSGDRLVSTGLDKTIRLWSLGSLMQEVVLPSYGSEPALRFSRDGTRLAATSASSTAHLFKIHDASAVCRILVNGRLGRPTLVGCLSFSPDGTRIASATYEGIDLWDTREGRLAGTYSISPDSEKSVRFLDDSSTLLVGSRKNGLRQYSISGSTHEPRLTPGEILDEETDFIFSNTPPGDRNLLPLTSSKKGVARVFDLQARHDLLRIDNVPEIWDLSISPDQKTIALSFSGQAPGESGHTQIWNMADRRKLTTLPGGQNGTARFSPDGTWIKASGRGPASGVWKTSDWTRDNVLDFNANNIVFHTGDNAWIAGASSETVIVWNRDGTGKYTLEPPLNKTRYTLLGFRLSAGPGGHFLAALSSNNTLLLWNLHELDERLRQYGLLAPKSLQHQPTTQPQLEIR
ncbi:hypothetical protein CMV30_18390 [Nibricoccus aquaticus]|uniref:Protein kinase domain-containing protein n=1 Tax=Nibricoccus aquaticus TaxID=2576891 RepID=A0A290QAR6_9BACT|nr:WD40 repeat domain-containing serine/threonine-protein kinase [Nibricoccus aquaticus]ATC65759.1 hypothetical protein CMV30_18390 [Nibricoccus aquaticus]